MKRTAAVVALALVACGEGPEEKRARDRETAALRRQVVELSEQVRGERQRAERAERELSNMQSMLDRQRESQRQMRAEYRASLERIRGYSDAQHRKLRESIRR